MPEVPPEPSTFKSKLDQLTRLVESLESGDLELEAAMLRFEEGKKLHAALAAELEGHEKRLERLTRAGREAVSEPGPSESARG